MERYLRLGTLSEILVMKVERLDILFLFTQSVERFASLGILVCEVTWLLSRINVSKRLNSLNEIKSLEEEKKKKKKSMYQHGVLLELNEKEQEGGESM
jgi:hypothetical protein